MEKQIFVLFFLVLLALSFSRTSADTPPYESSDAQAAGGQQELQNALAELLALRRRAAAAAAAAAAENNQAGENIVRAENKGQANLFGNGVFPKNLKEFLPGLKGGSFSLADTLGGIGTNLLQTAGASEGGGLGLLNHRNFGVFGDQISSLANGFADGAGSVFGGEGGILGSLPNLVNGFSNVIPSAVPGVGGVSPSAFPSLRSAVGELLGEAVNGNPNANTYVQNNS